MPKHPKKALKGRKSPCGPLKRTGERAEDWDNIIGRSLECLPSYQLPTVKTILQRYRCLRIEDSTASKSSLAKVIAVEAKSIWDRARIPTIEDRNCVRKVLEKIELWRKHRNLGENVEKLRSEMDVLCDFAPKLRGNQSEEAQLDHLKNLMRHGNDMKHRKTEGEEYDWKIDFNFYVDQYKVISNYQYFILSKKFINN